MRKLLTLLATIISLIAYSQRTFKIVSPVEGSFDPVYFHQGDSILFQFEASGFDPSYVFNVTIGDEIQATFKFSDFKAGKFSKKVKLIGSLAPYETPIKISVYTSYIWAWKLKVVTDINDDSLEANKEYKYYDMQGHEKQKQGLVFRSDGIKILYIE